MGLQQKNKVDAAFSMSSMTDIIFLLLIFFMLTSSFITPSGLAVNLPSSETSDIVMQEVTVSVTKDLQFSVNDQLISREDLKGTLTPLLEGKNGHVWQLLPSDSTAYCVVGSISPSPAISSVMY